MIDAERFAYSQVSDDFGATSLSPYLPLTLSYKNNNIVTSGLLDSGASVNVMPYQIGIQLGARWEQQTTKVQLTGNLANLPAYGLIVTATIAPFLPVRLAFAWTQAENVPLILGQVNFFLEFDVCFFRSQNVFEVRPKSTP
ncbi:MAG: retroviral-like aspartic protease [Candidatus Parabeggiatoa sp. nov. 2]|nr:MAG: retroviral-like aspartic protease [Gammaproteobacteria bacterium]HEC85791.1 retroviral-like aspartic protease [Thioploca sp.]